MPMTPQAAKAYKPRRPGVTLEDVVTPEQRARRAAAIEEARDAAMLPKQDKAYDEARTTPYRKGGYVKSADGCATKGKTKGRII